MNTTPNRSDGGASDEAREPLDAPETAATVPLTPPAPASGPAEGPPGDGPNRGGAEAGRDQEPETAPAANAPAAERDRGPGNDRDPGRSRDAAHDPAHDPGGAPKPPAKAGPRTGPIVWGALILAFCCYVVQSALAPDTVSAVTWVTVTVIGLGALLLLVGTAVVLRNARNARRTAPGLPSREG